MQYSTSIPTRASSRCNRAFVMPRLPRRSPYGLYYAPDPSSQIACSIGGNIAENSGGVHCLKYGLTVHNVLQATVITIDGDELTLGGESLDAPGFDLMAALIGSEGMLGVVVEAKLKLHPFRRSLRSSVQPLTIWVPPAARSRTSSPRALFRPDSK